MSRGFLAFSSRSTCSRSFSKMTVATVPSLVKSVIFAPSNSTALCVKSSGKAICTLQREVFASSSSDCRVMCPLCSMAMESHMSSTSRMEWVAIMTVSPLSATARQSISLMPWRLMTSRPSKVSSMRRMSGLEASAKIKAACRFMPLLMERMGFLRLASNFSASSA